MLLKSYILLIDSLVGLAGCIVQLGRHSLLDLYNYTVEVLAFGFVEALFEVVLC